MVKLVRIKPKKIDVMILYSEEWIKYCIPNNTSVERVTVTNKVITYVSSLSFFFILMRKIFLEKSLGGWRTSILLKILSSLVDTLNPAVIITRKDNAYSVISYLSNKYRSKLVCAVQNGARLSGDPCINYIDRHVHYGTFFGFGDYEYDLITKHGGVIDNYIAVGSLKNGLFLSNSPNCKKKYDLCFVSHYSSLGYKSNVPSILRMFEIINESLYKINKISKKNSLSFVIAAVKQDIEYKDYTPSFNEEVDLLTNTGILKEQIIPNENIKYRTYETCFSSEITIGVCSTVLFELLGSGKKVLFFGAGDEIIKNKLMKGNLSILPKEIKVESLDSDVIYRKILNLKNMSNDEYIRLTKNARSYYMKSSEPYPHKVIQNHITKFINKI
jgi:surface carbohydrate biosynthesis protein